MAVIGPLLPYGPGLAPPCSIPIPDVRAWRGEIVGSRSALRDKADGRVGVDHYSIILSSESVTIALTSGDSGRPPMAR